MPSLSPVTDTLAGLCRTQPGFTNRKWIEQTAGEDFGHSLPKKRIERTIPKMLWTSGNGGTATLQAAISGATMFELWSWTLGPGDRHDSEAHWPGTAELIAVSDGQLEIRVGQDAVRLLPGEAARLRTDQAHSYLAIGSNSASFTMAALEIDPAA